MGEQNTHIVPMPAFTDPNLPEAAGGSINFGSPNFPGVEDHPVKHSRDYGANVSPVDYGQGVDGNREDFKKDDWKALAEKYELSTSGTVAELTERINEHEKTLAADEG